MSMEEFISPEMQKKLETLESNAVYLKGYSDGMFDGHMRANYVLIAVAVICLLTIIGTVIYNSAWGC